MEEWKEYKYINLCSLIGGGTPKTSESSYWGGDIPWLSVKDFGFDRKYVYTTEKSITKEGLENSSTKLLQKDDIIISARGTIGAMAMIVCPMAFNQSCFGIRGNKLVDKDFLYYLTKTKIAELQKNSHGSVFETITRDTFAKLNCIIPPIKEQKNISAILKSLDEKIEVNRQINDNLEQQAQALFKSWFVDFEPFKDGEFVESELGMIPKGWRVVSLDDMTSKFGTGLNPRKNFKLGEGNNYYVTIKNMGNNRVYLDDKCDKVTDEAIKKINKRSKLQEGDLLFSGIGTIGRVALITETPTNWNTSESVFNMHPAKNISSEFLYVLLLSDIFQQYVKIHAQGGVQQGIRMASLKEYRMAIPEDFLLSHFDDLIKPIISKIKNSDKQSDRLATLRDTLLPKLMSGELKVNDLIQKI